MITVTATIKQKLLEAQISTLHSPGFRLPLDTTFEPPCSIKWMSIHHSLNMGAFSYAVSGYFCNVEFGRYVSAGEELQIGRGNHPVGWSSTSPLFYEPHTRVFNFDLEAASSVKLGDYLQGTPVPHPRRVVIGSDVWIGHGAFISPGVRVGHGAVIGAHSVVTKDVPPYAVVAGCPAVVRKMRLSDDLIERMLRVAWWRFPFWALRGAPIADPERFLDFVEQKIGIGLQEYRTKPVSVREAAATAT